MTETRARCAQPAKLPVPENDIERSIQAVLWHAQPPRNRAGRRREKRHPYPYPIRLTPVKSDGLTPQGDSILVLGKHLSQSGLDFYHCSPVPDRRMIATFNSEGQPAVHLLMELTWCRFGQYGWYENGGRFVQALSPETVQLSKAMSAAPSAPTVRLPIRQLVHVG